MSEPSREQFVGQVLQVLRSRFPLVKLAPAEQTFSILVNGQVAPLENLYRIALLRPNEMKRHVERWMAELLRAAETLPNHATSYEQVKDRIMPMVLSQAVEQSNSGAMVTQQFVEGLVIAYALDSERTIGYIAAQQFDGWHISVDELHETAINNLVNRSESIAAQAAADESGRINLIIFQTMDGYDASRILLPTLHSRLVGHLGSPFAAGIPNRDILLCFRDDEGTVERMRKQIADDFRHMPHAVTEQLLLVTPDGVAPRV
jgi:uncharacterized protein YtpQ (UPF0354 family)